MKSVACARPRQNARGWSSQRQALSGVDQDVPRIYVGHGAECDSRGRYGLLQGLVRLECARGRYGVGMGACSSLAPGWVGDADLNKAIARRRYPATTSVHDHTRPRPRPRLRSPIEASIVQASATVPFVSPYSTNRGRRLCFVIGGFPLHHRHRGRKHRGQAYARAHYEAQNADCEPDFRDASTWSATVTRPRGSPLSQESSPAYGFSHLGNDITRGPTSGTQTPKELLHAITEHCGRTSGADTYSYGAFETDGARCAFESREERADR